MNTTSSPTTFIYEPMDVHDKKIVKAYNDLLSDYEFDLFSIPDEKERDGVIQQLIHFIKVEPFYVEPMKELLGLYQIFQEQKKFNKLLEQIYKAALVHVTIDKKGNWYDVIPWGPLENRSIIRALIWGAEERWKKGKTAEAKKVFQNILKTNPGDNPGIRYQLLAILEGMTFEQFDEHMGDSEYVLPKIPKWFDKRAKFHPEFKELLKIWGDAN